MRRAKGVVFALRPLGETGEAVALAQGADPIAPTGQDLVWIGLVADVPDQHVLRRLEDVVQRHRQLDDAEPGAEMAAGNRDRVDGLIAKLVGELAEILGVEFAKIARKHHLIEKRGLAVGHFVTQFVFSTRQYAAPRLKNAA